jgi:hypothetical protein
MLARQKLPKYYAELHPTKGILLISARILNPVWKLLSFRKWDKRMQNNPEDTTPYTNEYREAIQKNVEN